MKLLIYCFVHVLIITYDCGYILTSEMKHSWILVSWHQCITMVIKETKRVIFLCSLSKDCFLNAPHEHFLHA